MKQLKEYLLWGILISLVLQLYSIAKLGKYIRRIADDFCFHVDALEMGAFGYVLHYYNSWSGRFSEGFFESFMVLNGSTNYNTVPLFLFIWIITLVFFIRVLFDVKFKREHLPYFIISPILIVTVLDILPPVKVRHALSLTEHTWDSFPGYFQSLYWISGRHSLIPPLILFPIIMGLLIFLLIKKQRSRRNILYFFIVQFLVIFSGGFGETYIVLQTCSLFFILFLWLLYSPNRKNTDTILLQVLTIISSLFAMIILIKAPGNLIRASYFPPPPDLISLLKIAGESSYSFIKYMLKWPGNIISICLTFFYSMYIGILSSNDPRTIIIQKHILKQLLVILSFSVLIFIYIGHLPAAYGLSKAPPSRSMITPIYFSLLLIVISGYLFGIYLNGISIFNNNIYFGRNILILLTFGFIINGYRDNKKINNQGQYLNRISMEIDHREKYIQEERDKGKSIIFTNKIFHFLDGKITSDSTWWVNECVDRYYGAKIISKSKY